MTTLDTPAPRARPRLGALVWWNAIFFTLLCATEAGLLAGALDWGVTGLFHLPPFAYLPLSAVLALAVAWFSVRLFRRAIETERALASHA